MADEAPIAPEPANEVKNLPDVSKGSRAFFDDEKFVYWLGIPLECHEPMVAVAILDAAKVDLLNKYKQAIPLMQQKAELRNKILNPSALAKARELMGSVGGGMKNGLKEFVYGHDAPGAKP